MIPWKETLHVCAPLKNVLTQEDRELEKKNAEQLKASYERGVRDGEKKINAQLSQQKAEILKLQDGVFASLRQSLPNVVNECQDNLIALAVEVAKKLVAGIPITSEMVEATIKEAMSELEETTDFTLMLNPSDLELLDKFNSVPRDEWAQRDKIQIVGSPDVSRGGCIIQTRFGSLDARRETKLELLQKNMQSQ